MHGRGKNKIPKLFFQDFHMRCSQGTLHLIVTLCLPQSLAPCNSHSSALLEIRNYRNCQLAMSTWTPTLATENLTERQRRNNYGINPVIIPNNCLLKTAALNVVLHCYIHIFCVFVSFASLIVTKSRQKKHCDLALALHKERAQHRKCQHKINSCWVTDQRKQNDFIDPWLQGILINNQYLQNIQTIQKPGTPTYKYKEKGFLFLFFFSVWLTVISKSHI